MKFSEAGRLGSLIMTAKPGTQDDGHDGGCAIGMALKACSIPVSTRQFAHGIGKEIIFGNVEDFAAARTAWPWLGSSVREYVCDCFCTQEFHYNYAGYLAHLFDVHVCRQGAEPSTEVWTLEQFFTYVESIEAPEFPSEAQLREALVAVQ